METLDKIFWSKELSVNYEKLDNQHQHLFEIINELVDEINLESQTEHFAIILSKLTNYSIVHFKEEEDYMKQNNFPSLLMHIEAHNNYRMQMALFNSNYLSTNPTRPHEVIEFLLKWWMNHIKIMDLVYKDFITGIKY
jgi:hemerythrin